MLNAHRSFDTLHGELRIWRHEGRSHEAFARQNENRRAGSQAMFFGGAGDAPEPSEFEQRIHVWLARPDRRREEWSGMPGSAHGAMTLVEVGQTWWSLDEHGARSNNGSPNMQHGSAVDSAMLDPAQLLAQCEFAVAGRATHAGRDAIRVRSRPSPRDAFLPETYWPQHVWPQELLVDTERGILLRITSLLDGEPFAVSE